MGQTEEKMMRHVDIVAVLLVLGCAPEVDDVQAREDQGPVSAFVSNLLADSARRWVTVKRDGFGVHALSGSYAESHLNQLADRSEDAREEVLARLDEPDQSGDPNVHIFFLAGPEDFVSIVGQPAGGWTMPDASAVLVAASDTISPPLRHELGHLYSHRRWGQPAATWLSEGVAVYAVGHCVGRSLHDWAASAAAQGEDLDVAAYGDAFDFSKAAPHLIAGSFIEYVAQTHGIDAVRALWRSGLDAAEASTGMSADRLQALWREHVLGPSSEAGASDLNLQGRVPCEP